MGDLTAANEELAAARARLSALLRLGDLCGGTGEPGEVLCGALRYLMDPAAAQVSRAALLLFDADGVLRTKELLGFAAPEAFRLAADGYAPWTAQEQAPRAVLVPDAAAAAGLPAPLRECLEAEGVRAVAFVPLTERGRLLGAFLLGYDRPGAPPAEEVQFAAAMAARLAFFIGRTRNEEALRRARERLHTVVSGSPLILFALDAAGVFTLSEGRGLMALGLLPGQVVGLSVFDVYRDVPEIWESVRRALAGEEFTALVRVGGTVFETHYVPVREGAQVTGVIGVSTNVTERQRAEEERAFLAEASHLLGSSLDYATTLSRVASLAVPRLGDWCAIWLAEEGRIHRVALAHADPSKRALVEEVQRSLPAELAEVSPVHEVLKSGRSILRNDVPPEAVRAESQDSFEFRLVHDLLGFKAGMTVPMVSHGKLLGAISLRIAEAGRRYGPADLALAEELARRAALAVENAILYREAQEAIRLREEFLSVASHELRSPMNILQLQIQNLVRTARGEGLHALPQDRLLGMLSTCDRHVRRLGELINRLFDVTRIAAGKLELNPEELDLSALVRDVMARFTEELRRAGCQLTLRAEAPAWGQWDRMRVEQVLVNLVQNAVKYGAGRPIEVRVEAGAQLARLSVSDRGIGIAEQDQERIFERFERVAPQRGGLGLGLYVVRKLAQAMGGAVEVKSQPGLGSTFTVDLPLRPA
jgi:signal transduction histidine kinase